MTTESDAVLATIADNWGGGGYGGATPKIQSTTDIAVDRWAALDAVIVLHDTLDELHPPVNDLYVNKHYTMDIRVTSITSEDQLKLLVEETEYLLNNTAITGFTSVRVTRKDRGSSDRGRKVYRNDMTILLKALLSSSAIAPSGGTLLYDLNEANMLGSANAAFVPCMYASAESPTKIKQNDFRLMNVDATNNWMLYILPLPTKKSNLKLYIGDIRLGVFAATGANYVNILTVRGMEFDNDTTLISDGTNRTAQGLYTYVNGPDDCSTYEKVAVLLTTVVGGVESLKINSVAIECYYDT